MPPSDTGPNDALHSSASDELRKRSPKKKERFRVYNGSQGNFVSVEVAILDTTAEPLKRLFDFLVNGSETGLWLNPYRGVPNSQGARFFDLVYLDEDNRVAWDVDHYPNPEFTVLEKEPASALLLQAHTAFASQLCPGDQLTICDIAELEGMLETLSSDPNLGSSVPRAKIAEQMQASRSESVRSESGSHPLPSREVLEQTKAERDESLPEKKASFGARIKQWFSGDAPSDQRSNRQVFPGLVAYHWSGGAPRPYELGNVSESGFYLLTDERPYPGTLILMTLQQTGSKGEKLGNSIAVYSKVIRWGSDGVGFAFVPLETKDPKTANRQSITGADRASLDHFLQVFDLPKRR